jgi:hypothetical protein
MCQNVAIIFSLGNIFALMMYSTAFTLQLKKFHLLVMDNSRFDITYKCVLDFDPYRSAIIFLKHNSDINGISNLLF